MRYAPSVAHPCGMSSVKIDPSLASGEFLDVLLTQRRTGPDPGRARKVSAGVSMETVATANPADVVGAPAETARASSTVDRSFSATGVLSEPCTSADRRERGRVGPWGRRARPVVDPAEVLDQHVEPYDVTSAAYGNHVVRDAEGSAVAEDECPVTYVGEGKPVVAGRDARVRGVQDHARRGHPVGRRRPPGPVCQLGGVVGVAVQDPVRGLRDLAHGGERSRSDE